MEPRRTRPAGPLCLRLLVGVRTIEPPAGCRNPASKLEDPPGCLPESAVWSSPAAPVCHHRDTSPCGGRHNSSAGSLAGRQARACKLSLTHARMPAARARTRLAQGPEQSEQQTCGADAAFDAPPLCAPDLLNIVLRESEDCAWGGGGQGWRVCGSVSSPGTRCALHGRTGPHLSSHGPRRGRLAPGAEDCCQRVQRHPQRPVPAVAHHRVPSRALRDP